MNQEGDCPIFDVDTDVNKASMALHAHCSLAEEFAEQFSTDCFASYVANVWKLCVALWGTLPDINVASGMIYRYINLQFSRTITNYDSVSISFVIFRFFSRLDLSSSIFFVSNIHAYKNEN